MRIKAALIVLSVLNLSSCDAFEAQSKPITPIEEGKEKLTLNKEGFEAKSNSALHNQMLGDYILHMMDIVNYQGSKAKRNAIARAIVNVSNEIFDTPAQKEQFVVMIAIESKFDENAVSPAGALGLTQIMPQYAREFGKRCGILDIKDKDLTYPDINLLLGACRFRELLELLEFQPVPALVAYNAGLASDQLKQLKTLRNITNTETTNYIVRWSYLKDLAEKVKDDKSK